MGALVSSCIAFSFALSACSAGPTTRTADTSELPATEERVSPQEVVAITQAEPVETADATPKRQPEDPIYVKMPAPVLDSKMQSAEKPKGAIGQYIRNEFASDPVIQLVPSAKRKMGKKTSQSPLPAPDVEVASKVSLKEVFSIMGNNGKPTKTLNIVFEATITSQNPQAVYTVSESGHVLQNMAVSKRFARKVRDVIVDKIGPDIPAR
jgi:hypothetical protein